MLNLFQKAILEYWKASRDQRVAQGQDPNEATGDQRMGQVHHPLAEYRWEIVTPKGSSDLEHSLFPYLCDFPNEGWAVDQITLVGEVLRIGQPCLYIGAGGGRFYRYLESVGVSTANIDLAPECIELMGLRNIPSEEQNGLDMSFPDSSHDNVILHSDGVLDAIEDPTALITEASRVARKTVLISGYEFPNEGEIDASETHEVTTKLTWQGESAEATYYAHHHTKIEGILTNLGMSLEGGVTKVWGQEQEEGTNEPQLYGMSWLIEAKW